MATRTIKLMGTAYSTTGDVSVVVNFNNTEVFNGTVNTVNLESPLKGESTLNELASWTVDTSVSGNIPLTITVNGGTLHFVDLHGNYTGYALQETDGVPDVVDGAYVVTTSPAEFFAIMNLNTSDSDGKNNVSFSDTDGDAQQRSAINEEEAIGEWVYMINDGITFSCNFVVDASMTVVDVPTPV